MQLAGAKEAIQKTEAISESIHRELRQATGQVSKHIVDVARLHHDSPHWKLKKAGSLVMTFTQKKLKYLFPP